MSALQLSTQYKNEKKIKFLNKKIEIQNEIIENQIENYIKVK